MISKGSVMANCCTSKIRAKKCHLVWYIVCTVISKGSVMANFCTSKSNAIWSDTLSMISKGTDICYWALVNDPTWCKWANIVTVTTWSFGKLWRFSLHNNNNKYDVPDLLGNSVVLGVYISKSLINRINQRTHTNTPSMHTHTHTHTFHMHTILYLQRGKFAR